MRKNKDSVNLVEILQKLDFDSNNEWIWKRPGYTNWSNTPEIWEEVAKGTEGEAYTQIIKIINEIITNYLKPEK